MTYYKDCQIEDNNNYSSIKLLAVADNTAKSVFFNTYNDSSNAETLNKEDYVSSNDYNSENCE